MANKNPDFDEHYEDLRARIGVRFKLDDIDGTVYPITDGEHSIEKYLARLEAKKKAQAEKSDS